MEKVAQLKLDVAYQDPVELDKIYNILCNQVSKLGNAKTVGDFYDPEDMTKQYESTLASLKKQAQCTCVLDSQEEFRKSSICPVHT